MTKLHDESFCFIYHVLKITCSRLVTIVYNFFLPQTLYISSMKPSLNRTTIFKLSTWNRATHGNEERER